MKNKNFNQYLGCLIGGAAGDALGYPVEFLSEDAIRSAYGPEGIREYELCRGTAQISDDTQMTLFTANGLLYSRTACLFGTEISPIDGIRSAYREWYRTQKTCHPQADASGEVCWLSQVQELFARRAPGSTCLKAIEHGADGSFDNPINSSKGCGGVMRVAPVGLICSGNNRDEPCLLGAAAAALTHTHELGYLPAAMLAEMIWVLTHSETRISVLDAALQAEDRVRSVFPQAKYLQEFTELVVSGAVGKQRPGCCPPIG